MLFDFREVLSCLLCRELLVKEMALTRYLIENALETNPLPAHSITALLLYTY